MKTTDHGLKPPNCEKRTHTPFVFVSGLSQALYDSNRKLATTTVSVEVGSHHLDSVLFWGSRSFYNCVAFCLLLPDLHFSQTAYPLPDCLTAGLFKLRPILLADLC